MHRRKYHCKYLDLLDYIQVNLEELEQIQEFLLMYQLYPEFPECLEFPEYLVDLEFPGYLEYPECLEFLEYLADLAHQASRAYYQINQMSENKFSYYLEADQDLAQLHSIPNIQIGIVELLLLV